MGSAFAPVANIPGGMTQLQQVVCTGSQATISFMNIPSNYSDLMIVFTGRATGSGGGTSLAIKFNNDATAGNYVGGQFLLGANTTPSAGVPGGTFAANMSGTASGVNSCTGCKIVIPNYAGTVLPQVFFCENYMAQGSSTTSQDFLNGGLYTLAAAINRIDLTIASGTILDGSVATLYGLGTGPGNSRGYDEVTANPTTNLVDGRKVYRTDLDLLIVYKAALGKWLTVNEFPIGKEGECADSIAGASGSTNIGRHGVRSDYSYYVTRFAFASFLAGGTSNSSNKWAVLVSEYNGANSVVTSWGAIDTGTTPDTASNWVQHDVTVNTALNAATKSFQVNVTKTGSPGNLYPAYTLYGRLIIT